MESLFVKYDQSLNLKELGFDEPCFGYYGLNNIEDKLFFDIDPDDGELTALNQNQFYHNNLSEVGRISSPLKQQVFRWFREKHGLSGIPDDESYSIWKLILGVRECIKEVYPLNNFEEAESDCINKLIEIVKNKTDEKDNTTDNNSNNRLHL